jgi:hypothetical protein
MRDRDEAGRAHNARPRDALGRPLPYGAQGVPPLPEPLDLTAEAAVALAEQLLDAGMPFQAHEVLESIWKTADDDQRPAWQGLAQLAVSLTHQLRGNPVGAQRLRERGLVNLAAGHVPAIAERLRDRLRAATS